MVIDTEHDVDDFEIKMKKKKHKEEENSDDYDLSQYDDEYENIEEDEDY